MDYLKEKPVKRKVSLKGIDHGRIKDAADPNGQVLGWQNLGTTKLPADDRDEIEHVGGWARATRAHSAPGLCRTPSISMLRRRAREGEGWSE